MAGTTRRTGGVKPPTAAASTEEVRELIDMVSEVIPKIEHELDRIDSLIRQRKDQAAEHNHHSDPEEPRA